MNQESEPLENPSLMGRPSGYSQDVADRICELMQDGKGLREVCNLPEMPSRTSVLRWLEANADFRSQYARARMHCMDFYAEEILKIAFDESGDILIDGNRTSGNHAKVQRDKLKIDTLKFIMSKLAPKRYGADPDELAPAELHPINKIELVGVGAPVQFSWEKSDQPTDDAPASAEPAKQITYQPSPPPADLSPEAWSAIARVSDLIERIAPGDEKPEIVFGLIEGFLHSHYGV